MEEKSLLCCFANGKFVEKKGGEECDSGDLCWKAVKEMREVMESYFHSYEILIVSEMGVEI